ncbi:MAG: TolC family protein [Candidatus Cloacimonetes bacterium]|nr:TolC family protein [Candidatus Cloacimonadota bacterium]
MRRLLIISLLLLVGLGMLYAQPKPKEIGLAEAREMALANNPEYLSSLAALNAARWNKTGAISAFMPSLSLSGTMLYMDPATTVTTGGGQVQLNNDQRSLSLNLSQPLFVGGKLYQAYKISAVSLEMQELAVRSQRLDLIREVESKYYDLRFLISAHHLAVDERDRAQSNLELAELKKQSGLISNADYLRFKAAKANKDVAVIQTETAMNLANKDFCNFLGSEENLWPAEYMRTGEPARVIDIDDSWLPALIAKAQKMASASNPTLQTLDKSLELSRRAEKIAGGSFMPTLMLTGSRQYKENGIDRYEFEASNQIMLNLSVPILPQVGNYAALKKAQYDSEKARYEARSATDGINLGVEAAVLNLASSARQALSTKLSYDATWEMFEQLTERYNLQMISPSEYLDAELMESAAGLANLNAHNNYLKARLELLIALGADDYTVLDSLIEETRN